MSGVMSQLQRLRAIPRADVALEECFVKSAAAGHVGTVQFLLLRGVRPSSQMTDRVHFWKPPVYALQAALHGGHATVANILMSAGAAPVTALPAACSLGDLEILQNLWLHPDTQRRLQEADRMEDAYALAQSSGEQLVGWMLDAACEAGHAHVVQFLFGRAAQYVDARRSAGRLLLSAASRGHTNAVLCLWDNISAHADVAHSLTPLLHLLGPAAQASLMETCAARGHLELCRILTERGLSVHAGGSAETSPLAEAVKHRHLHVVDFLLQAGARPFALDWLALQRAMQTDQPLLVTKLLDAALHTVRVHTDNDAGAARSALDQVQPLAAKVWLEAVKDDRVACVRLLLGVNVTSPKHPGPESRAAGVLDEDFITRVRLSLALTFNGTPGAVWRGLVLVAARCGHRHMLELLLDHTGVTPLPPPRVNSREMQLVLNKALVCACERLDADTARVLLVRGADANHNNGECSRKITGIRRQIDGDISAEQSMLQLLQQYGAGLASPQA